MRTPVAALRAGAVPSAIAVAFVACSPTQIDAIAPPAAGGDATVEAAEADSDNETADSDDETASQDSPSSLACSNSAAPVQEWTFDTTIQGWIVTVDPVQVTSTVTWTGSTGDPAPGALQVDFTPAPPDAGRGSAVWVQFDMAPSDFTDRTLSAWAWLDSGPSPHFLTYALTGASYVWADNKPHTLAPHTWTCLSLPLSTPAFNNPGYDPTQVVRIGFEMYIDSPFRVFLDTVRIQ